MWRESVPEDVYYLRLNDPAQSFKNADNLRFSLRNPFDNIMYRYPILMAVELKSSMNTGFSFWRSDFNNTKCMLKREQIEGLLRARKYYGIIAGFVLNFRRTGNTFFVLIDDFIEYTDKLNKKSINESDVRRAGGYVIGCKKLKVNYRYDIGGLFDDARAGIFDRFD